MVDVWQGYEYVSGIDTAWKLSKYGVFFLSVFSCIGPEYRQKKLRIWTLFRQRGYAMVLNIPGFWYAMFTQGSEDALIIPEYVSSCHNISEYAWIYQIMCEYAEIRSYSLKECETWQDKIWFSL